MVWVSTVPVLPLLALSLLLEGGPADLAALRSLDWAGAGTVRKLGVRFAGLVRLKDVITCRGRVLAKSSRDDEHLVELEVWAENQRSEKVVTGKAAVALPPREP